MITREQKIVACLLFLFLAREWYHSNRQVHLAEMSTIAKKDASKECNNTIHFRDSNGITRLIEGEADDLFQLQSGLNLATNEHDITLRGHLQWGMQRGKACLQFKVMTKECLFPYIRCRLSGTALLHVHLEFQTPITANQQEYHVLEGCTDIPVPGIYFVDAHLLSCLHHPLIMNDNSPNVSHSLYVIRPNFNISYEPLAVDTGSTVDSGMQISLLSNANKRQGVWIYNPVCSSKDVNRTKDSTQNGIILRSANCGPPPRFLPTIIQDDRVLETMGWTGFNDTRRFERYDDYLFVSTAKNMSTSDLLSHPHSFSSTDSFWNPSISSPDAYFQSSLDFFQQRHVCLVGASHLRYTHNEIIHRIFGINMGSGYGCARERYRPLTVAMNDTITYIPLKFASDAEWKQVQLARIQSSNCRYIVLSYGQWPCCRRTYLSPSPRAFGRQVTALINDIQSLYQGKNSTVPPIWMTSINTMPLRRTKLEGLDWGTPPVVDAYNDEIRRAIQQISDNSSIAPVMWMDNRDIVEPIWDSAKDMNHPCRLAMGPIGLRILMTLREYDARNG